MPVPANGHMEITVLAAASGQAVINVMHYKANSSNAGTATLQQYLSDFVDEWRANILPRLHSSYAVQAYIGRLISGMIYLPVVPPQAPNSRPAMRYSEQVILQGDSNDVGDVATDAHPTFTAISVQKVCGQVTDPANVALPNEKIIRGGIRFGPIAEAATDATDGNALATGVATAWLTGLNALSSIDVGTENAFMEVLSFYKDKVHREVGGLPTFARAVVNSFLVNPYASTQVTRKQRARGGA